MKLVRFGEAGRERAGIVDADGHVRDISRYAADITGETISPEALDRLRDVDIAALPIVPAGTRIGPCVGSVGKIICIGLNYSDHAAESGMDLPEEPVVFMKPVSAICGPNDDVEIPRGAEKTDWEVELGIVIGKSAKYVKEADALDYVAGYCVVNDVSERAFQIERGGTWDKGKGHDTFAPIGPWLVTRDEIADPQKLDLWLDVDGKRCQSGSTANMIFGVGVVISYLSCFMSLQPGDIIATGTPSGVGMGQKPPVYLKPGQRMRLGIDGLGEQEQLTISAERRRTLEQDRP